MNEFAVSIIIPFYNRVDLLKITIENILNQSFKHFELILIDDGSSNFEFDSLDRFVIKKNDSRVLLFKRPSNYAKGGNGARNYGLRKSSGKYIKWFDSDDLMHVSLLEEQINILQQGYDFTLCESEKWNSDFTEIVSRRWRDKCYSKDILRDYIRGKLQWQTNSGLYKKSLFDADKEPFNEELLNSQEWLFHIEMIINHKNFAILDSPLNKFRGGQGNSISSRKNSEYFFYRFKARIIALNLLIEKNFVGQYLLLYVILNNLFLNKNIFRLILEIRFIKLSMNLLSSKNNVHAKLIE